MVLRKLVEYAARDGTADAPKLYAEGPLRYVIELGLDGECHGLIDLGPHHRPEPDAGRVGCCRKSNALQP